METYRLRTKTMVDIPEEILSSEILSRLPAKCVLSCKCVSKRWYSLLTTQMFKKAHLDHISDDDHQNPDKLLLLSAREFRTIDCEAPEDGVRVTRSRALPFPSRATNIKILASCHGLVCVGVLKNIDNYYFSDLILWNPLTSDCKTLSKKDYEKECYANNGIGFGLYYSATDNDYKLLRVITDDDLRVYIYSLKNDSWGYVADSTNSLREIPYLRFERGRLCTWLNENLYFLKQGVKGDDDSRPQSCSFIKFDTKTEMFTEIQSPSFEIYKGGSYFLTVQRGKIHLSVKHNIGSVETQIMSWSLNGENWKMVECYPLKLGLISDLKPLHLMRNKKWLMIHFSGRRSSVYEVDVAKKDRKGAGTCSYTLVDMGIPEEVRYIETFVSPNQF